MGSYTLRLLDVTDQVAKVFEQEYRDALDALDAAKRLASEGTIEVWTQYGRIARIKKGNQPARPEDRVSG
jgi:hypothetical protein